MATDRTLYAAGIDSERQVICARLSVAVWLFANSNARRRINTVFRTRCSLQDISTFCKHSAVKPISADFRNKNISLSVAAVWLVFVKCCFRCKRHICDPHFNAVIKLFIVAVSYVIIFLNCINCNQHFYCLSWCLPDIFNFSRCLTSLR